VGASGQTKASKEQQSRSQLLATTQGMQDRLGTENAQAHDAFTSMY
jgi:hypothetical protein